MKRKMVELDDWQMEHGAGNIEPFAFSPSLGDHILWIDVCLPNHKRRAYELDEEFLLLVPKMTLLQQPQERICHLIYTCRSTCLPKTVPIDREADIKHVYLSDVLGFSSSPGSQPQITWGIWSNCGESWRVFTIPRKTLGIPPPGLLGVLGPQGPG